MGADIGDWEIKAGSTFTKKDMTKGKYILWVNPWEEKEEYVCDYETCRRGTHHKLTGYVEILGWTHLAEDEYKDCGGYYRPVALRSAALLVKELAA
jgi:hypothetical protein